MTPEPEDHRLHYLTGYPATTYPTDADLPEILCGNPDPYDWDTDAGAVDCPDCLLLLGDLEYASLIRRRELDAWQPDTGEHHVIRITDLGAALQANHCGRAALFVAHLFASHGGPEDGPAWTDRNVPAIYAAHLARQALGRD